VSGPQCASNPRRDEVLELRLGGVGPREIARLLDISPGAVAGLIHRAGLSLEPKGRGHAKLDSNALAEIRRRRLEGERIASIAADFDVIPSTISEIARRRNYWAER